MQSLSFEAILPNIVLVKCSSVAIVVARGDRLAVIDSGLAEYMPRAIEPALASLGETLSDIQLVVHTHGHFDHVQGTPSLVRASHAQVWIPAAEFDRLPLPADRLLVDGDSVDLGGLNFHVIATPGHSPAISCFYEPSHHFLVASDVAQGYGDGGLPLYFHSGQAYRRSLKKLMELEIETMVLGHPFRWSGRVEMVQHGAETVRAYLAESLHAATLVQRAVQAAANESPDHTLRCITEATVRRLVEEPDYPSEPASDNTVAWFAGTVHSELRDRGLLQANPNVRH